MLIYIFSDKCSVWIIMTNKNTERTACEKRQAGAVQCSSHFTIHLSKAANFPRALLLGGSMKEVLRRAGATCLWEADQLMGLSADKTTVQRVVHPPLYGRPSTEYM